MQVNNYIVWDIETGGFNKEKEGLAEIAAIAIDSESLEEIDRWEAIIAPYQLPSGEMSVYNPAALAVNGLTMAQINGGMPAKQAANEFAAFCKKNKKPLRGNPGKCFSVGHNIDEFDIPYTAYFLNIFGVDFWSLFQKSTLDTLAWTRHCYPVDGSIVDHKLGTACTKAGVHLFDAHRAMNDVEGNAKLLIHYLQRLRNPGGQIVTQERESVRDNYRF